jgi:hypothetical protein
MNTHICFSRLFTFVQWNLTKIIRPMWQHFIIGFLHNSLIMPVSATSLIMHTLVLHEHNTWRKWPGWGRSSCLRPILRSKARSQRAWYDRSRRSWRHWVDNDDGTKRDKKLWCNEKADDDMKLDDSMKPPHVCHQRTSLANEPRVSWRPNFVYVSADLSRLWISP